MLVDYTQRRGIMYRIRVNIFQVDKEKNFSKYKARINYKGRQATIVFEQNIYEDQLTEGKHLLYNWFLDSALDLSSFKNFCRQQREENYEYDIDFLKSKWEFIKEVTAKLKKLFQDDFKTLQEISLQDDYCLELGRHIMFSQYHPFK